MQLNRMVGYVGSILRGISAFKQEANELAKQAGEQVLTEDMKNLGIIVVAVDESTGACIVTHQKDAGEMTLNVAREFDAMTRERQLAKQQQTNEAN
jgi:hypothetical protein